MNGWNIRESHHSAFVRELIATPTEQILVEFATVERHKGKVIDAIYDARVLNVRIRHQWDEAKGEWWSQASRTIRLINSTNGEDYESGWRSESITEHTAHLKGVTEMQPLIDETRPKTKITVIEESHDSQSGVADVPR